MKATVLALGGTCVSAISKKVDVLLVGDAPGAGKISKANALNVQIIDVAGLRQLISGDRTLECTDAPIIDKLSSGFNGNGIANLLTGDQRHALLHTATDRRQLLAPVDVGGKRGCDHDSHPSKRVTLTTRITPNLTVDVHLASVA